ncbi:MAG: divergent polysaccharide deacetylase family protein, partial [Proteobacteria bacterium]|nr:divergent polysaccharide deacetylase family protein [Pseudomonadota bacterium]MBU1612742.1 divergent polysaccharide deacetylase family protein [Pseudomonadota bacterium]
PDIPTLPAEIKGRMSIVIDDMGEDLRLAQGLAETGLKLTFAVWPASSEKDRIRELAHRHGLDLMVHLPMQPLGYPDMDPGPGALFVTMTPQEIETTIKWNLDQIPEAVGVNNHMGSLFTADLQGMTSALTAISRRGLFFLDSRTIGKSSGHAAALATRTPFYSRDVFIDNEKNIAYIIGQLRKAEAMARRRGSAIAIGHPHPETLAALRQWNMNKGADILVVSITGLPPETP